MTRARRYLAVPFAEKDEAKALGARWCPEVRLWYIPPEVPRKLFRWPDAPKQSVKPLPPPPKPKMQKSGRNKYARAAMEKANLSADPSKGSSARLQNELDSRLKHLLDEP
jgi:hypothetical protein